MIKDSLQLIDAENKDGDMLKKKEYYKFLSENEKWNELSDWMHYEGFLDGYAEGFIDGSEDIIMKREPAIQRHGTSKFKRVYLSGSITGLSRSEYMHKFHVAEQKFRKKGYSVINPAAVCDELPEMSHDEYMQVALLLLSKADFIHVIDGEETSKGVKEEIAKANELGIKRIEI